MDGFGISTNADALARKIDTMLTRQLPFATARALNDTAKDVVADTKRLMGDVFDRPTPFTLNAFYAGPVATKDDLSVTVRRKDQVVGKHYLETEQSGGARGQTGLDKLLSMRIAHAGQIWGVVPGDAAKLDKYGNWSAGERNQVLAVLKAMRDGAANETSRSRKRAGAKRARYFVSPPQFKTPGVWKRLPGLRQPQLVLLFVESAPVYKPVMQFRTNAERVVGERMQEHFRRRLAEAMATAR